MACSGSAILASEGDPNTVLAVAAAAAPALSRALVLAPDPAPHLQEDDDKILVHRCEIRRDSRNSGCQLHDGRAVTSHGCCQVSDGIHCVLVEVTFVQVCGGVVRRSVGGACIVLNQEVTLPMGSNEKHFEIR